MQVCSRFRRLYSSVKFGKFFITQKTGVPYIMQCKYWLAQFAYNQHRQVKLTNIHTAITYLTPAFKESMKY